MSDIPVVNLDELPLSDDLVAEYLQSHPYFFSQHPELLSQLKVADNQRGTVSLVEKQLQLLRHKNQQLQDEITQLMAIAGNNEKLFAVYNDIYLALIDCHDLDEILTCVEQTVVELLGLHSLKVCFATPQATNHSSIVPSKHFATLTERLNQQEFYLGRLTQAQLESLSITAATGSVIMFNLYDYQANNDTPIAVVVISSQDPEHFAPQMDTLLISQFRNLLSKLVSQQLN